MSEYTFLFKENETDDRDCVAYVKLDDLKGNHTDICDHIIIHGACYCKELKEDDPQFDDLTTVLTEKEYKTLCNPKGKDLTRIIAKLESEKNKEIFEEVQEEEADWLCFKYELSGEDVDDIFDEYYLDYRDRGIVSYVFENAEELGREEAFELGHVDDKNPLSNYIDYDSFDNALLEYKEYFRLSDGRVVCLNY